MSRHLDGTGTGHPILGLLDLLDEGLDAATDAPSWSLGAEETTGAITRLVAHLSRLAEVQARLLGQAEALDLPGSIGARGLAPWLSRMTRMTPGEAARHVRFKKTLEAHDRVRTAVGRGEVLPDQATVIGAAVDDLDDEYAAEREQAETYLVEQAAHFDANKLRELGRKIVEVIDPECADEHEARLLARQEEQARKRAELCMRNGGDGTVRGSFVLPELQAEMFRKTLQALASPKHVRSLEGAGSYDHERPTPHKMGLAFIEYIERYPLAGSVKMGGTAATVVITADADIFTSGRQRTGRTEGGAGVSPGQLLRLACEAKVMPAVLDTSGHVLDLGRSRRFHTEPQRLALIVEQRTCQHPSCDVAGAFCHVHHTTPWSRGGPTTTADAVLLCPFHHHQAHAREIDYPIRT